VGHIQKISQSRKPSAKADSKNGRKPPSTHPETKNSKVVKTVQKEASPQFDEYHLFNVNAPAPTNPLVVDVIINTQSLSMKVNTGSAVSLSSESTFANKWPNTPLQSSSVKLKTYSNEQLHVLGQFEVSIQYSHHSAQLSLVVVEGNGSSLFGRDWLLKFYLDWKQYILFRNVI